jgi:transposase
MIDLSKVRSYYIACGYTDLRLGIDGLAAVVTQQFGGHLDEESLFLFCGRRTDRIKALYWSGDGYILLYKRLSNGRFQWSRSEAELRQLDPQSFRWLMEGLRAGLPYRDLCLRPLRKRHWFRSHGQCKSARSPHEA